MTIWLAPNRVSSRKALLRHRFLIGLMGAVATLTIAALLPQPARADGSLAGSAGTNTALPSTDSAVTISGRGPFRSLKVTVNQTKQLVNQAVSVTWTGGRQPVLNGGQIEGNFLQIFQCWGDPDTTTVPSNPGPSPQQCEFGGNESNGAFTTSSLDGSAIKPGFVDSRRISASSWPTYDPGSASCSSPTPLPNGATCHDDQNFLWEPFRAVDGTVVNADADFSKNDPSAIVAPTGFWHNPYFDFFKTNEDYFAMTHPDGTGSELFTVDTGLEASGLGCGQHAQLLPDGSAKVPQCWLVIVPRGTPAEENPPSIPGNPLAVVTSPLGPSAWQNRIAIPLDFNPVDSPCQIGGNERRIVGSELPVLAVINWQPTLCSTPGAPPYNYSSVGDGLARSQLASNVAGGAGMAVVSQPIDPGSVDPSNPVVYAPLTLSGVTIGFNIERVPPISGPDPKESNVAGIRVAHINLTPRLVAKLLTESYQQQFVGLITSSSHGKTVPKGYEWILTNPRGAIDDPEFQQYNPEFKLLDPNGLRGVASAVVEEPSSDAAYELWSWILADPEAAAWLAGTPDPWGMKVNPVYNTNSQTNPTGTGFGSPIPDHFPKSDPFQFINTSSSCISDLTHLSPRPLSIIDMSPYASSMQAAALAARLGDDGAKLGCDNNGLSPDTAWFSLGPENAGARRYFSVSDTPSAYRYGLQTAALSRAGDDARNRTFVAPDNNGLLAGERAMVPSTASSVLQPSPATKIAGAYPLTMLTYAAAMPGNLDTGARADYANFIDYAVGPGQVPGLEFGQLPPGYAPLPADLVAQARAAADLIRNGLPPSGNINNDNGGSANVGAGSNSQGGPGAGGLGSGAGTSAGSPGAGGAGPGGGNAASSPGGGSGNNTSPLSGRRLQPVSSSSRSRTPFLGVGLVRFLLLILLGAGLAAAVASRALGKQKQRRKGGSTPSTSAAPTPLPVEVAE